MAKVHIEIENTEENRKHLELLFGDAPNEKGKSITVELKHQLDSQAVALLLTAVSNLSFSKAAPAEPEPPEEDSTPKKASKK